MEFFLGEDPTLEKSIDSKEAKLSYLLSENVKLKEQLEECKNLLKARDNVSTYSMLRESCSGEKGNEEYTIETAVLVKENKKLYEMLDKAQHSREEEAARVNA